jgi:hypothetical protein
LWPLKARKSAVAGSGRWGASWAASTSTGTPRSCALAMIASIGGTQPVTFEAPVTASSRGLGSASSASRTAASSKVPSASHSTKRRDPAPWQQVRVVLDHGRQDHVARRQREPVGEMVDRLGRVAADHRHVAAVRAPGEPPDRLTRVLVRRRRQL